MVSSHTIRFALVIKTGIRIDQRTCRVISEPRASEQQWSSENRLFSAARDRALQRMEDTTGVSDAGGDAHTTGSCRRYDRSKTCGSERNTYVGPNVCPLLFSCFVYGSRSPENCMPNHQWSYTRVINKAPTTHEAT
jgi:hypothetical protein